MSLFRRESESATSSSAVDRSRAVAPPERGRTATSATTHIAPGTRVQGEITGATEVLVDGHLEGNLSIDSRLTVGRGGRVDGTIRAKSVRISGKVKGDILCQERIELLESGALEGDVMAPRVVISEGAFFKGKVEMKEPPGRVAPESSSKKQQSAAPSSKGQGKRVGEHPEGKR